MLKKNKKIKACLLVKKKKLSFCSLPIKKLKSGQVVVKLRYSSICQTQINEFYEKKDTSKFYPHTLGHEGSGIVIEKSKDVKKVNIGDKVVITWLNCKGVDSGPQTFEYNNVAINSGSFFAFSDIAVVSENKIMKLSPEINMKLAPLLGCAIPTAFGSVDRLNVKKNHKVAIVGLGGVGLSILIYLQFLKINNVVLFDVDKNKIDFIKRNFPQFEVIDSKNIDLKKFKDSFDFSLECAGSVQAMEFSFSIISNTGTCLIIGNDHFDMNIKINPFDLIKGKKIFGSWGGNIDIYEKKFKKYEAVLKKNENLFKKLFNNEYSFLEIKSAFQEFGKKGNIRPLIKF